MFTQAFFVLSHLITGSAAVCSVAVALLTFGFSFISRTIRFDVDISRAMHYCDLSSLTVDSGQFTS